MALVIKHKDIGVELSRSEFEASDLHQISGHDLDAIDDVNVPSPTDGYALTYDSASGLWVASAIISDDTYGAGWDGVTTIAPSKNAVYDKVNAHENDADAHHAKTGDNEVYGLILCDTVGNRPAAGTAGRFFWATDEHILYRDDGASWSKAAVADHADLDGIGAGDHHTKYTDAEAVTAAKTVKLDDFTAPDDTTDLDFSTSKHGLVPKGTNVGDFLKDDGTWAAAAGDGATKEFFAPPSVFFAGADAYYDSDHAGVRLDANGEAVHVEFYMPQDFNSLTSAVLVVIPYTTATHRLNFTSDYGAHGQSRSIHSEASYDNDYSLTDDEIDELDISGILSSLAAGDYVGIAAKGDATNTSNLLIIGVRIKYS